MKIFDMHIHADGSRPYPKKPLDRMAQTGIFGGVIFSVCPQ